MKEATIRFAEKADLDDLIQLCQLHAIFEKCDYDTTDKKQKLSNHLFSVVPTLYCLVVEHLDTIVGYATYMKQFSTWDADFYIYMDCLFMTEASRGLGIGEQLVNRIKQEGHLLRCSHIQWQTPDFNERAMKFYARIGAKSKSKERYFLDI